MEDPGNGGTSVSAAGATTVSCRTSNITQASRACEAELADFSYAPDPTFFVNILRVFRVMLEDNLENQAWMQKHKGFSVIGVQLEKISPLHFSSDALDALEKLSDVVAEEEKLLEDCCFGILARMRLWIYTSAEVKAHKSHSSHIYVGTTQMAYNGPENCDRASILAAKGKRVPAPHIEHFHMLSSAM